MCVQSHRQCVLTTLSSYAVHKSLSDETQKYIEIHVRIHLLCHGKTRQSEVKEFGHILLVFILRYIFIYYH